MASIGSVCELPTVNKFFNGNPMLGTVAGGIDHFTGRAGRKRWNSIAEIIARGWDDVLAAIDGIVSTPDVDGPRRRGQPTSWLSHARTTTRSRPWTSTSVPRSTSRKNPLRPTTAWCWAAMRTSG
ncbi:hypothetical protein I553_0394 [Mycobacterium xenopi 4042]|uniref:Uncharacterized protein n=1 Tax=Mycobacterium xenopi 4042 TaxID=1299334 RepID=X7YKC1_MYCXE|nr:hypothetical protein I553_0394 [Mycobacterium xenopi 4042]